MRVLLVQSDRLASRAINLALKAHGNTVTEIVNTGWEALEMVRIYEYDAVVLDLQLPDTDGYNVLRQMREGRSNIPVLALNGSRQPQAQMRAFGLGADDVVSKPFDLDELVARIQAVVRRRMGHSQASIQVGPVQLRLDIREVTVNGAPVSLTAKEYAVLELLLMRRGTVMTKETFMSHLYGSLDGPDTKILDVFICKLRKKLADAGAKNVIGTVWGRGYVVRSAEVLTTPDNLTTATAFRLRHEEHAEAVDRD